MSAGDKKRKRRLSCAFCSMRKRPSRTLPSVPMERMRQIHTLLAAPWVARSMRSSSASASASPRATPALPATTSASARAALLRIARLALLQLGADLLGALALGQDLLPRRAPEALEPERVRVPRIDVGLEGRRADRVAVEVDLRALGLAGDREPVGVALERHAQHV